MKRGLMIRGSVFLALCLLSTWIPNSVGERFNLVPVAFSQVQIVVPPGKPNLTPFQPTGWSDKIVVSNVTGTTTDSSSLSPTDTLYVDFAVTNSTDTETGAGFSTYLLVDGSVVGGMNTPSSLFAFHYVQYLDYNIGSLSVGPHTIQVVADATNVIDEGDESDNQYTKTITVIFVDPPTLPNLTPFQPIGWSDKILVSNVSGMMIDSSPLYSTDTLYVSWAVTNLGADINVTISTYLYVDGVFKFNDITPPPLYSNSFEYVPAYSIGSLSAGTHTIKIVADPTNAVVESDESDNQYSKTITVMPADRPNLTPFQPSGWSDMIVVSNVSGTTTDSSTLKSTDTLYVDFAVTNNGNKETLAAFSTTLYVDGVKKFDDITSSPLNPGQQKSVTDHSIGSLSAGTHTIKIVADTTNAIVESDESDNQYTKTITVVPPPQPTAPNLTPFQPSGWSDMIVVSNVSGATTDSSSLSSTDTLYVSWAVINNGESATTAALSNYLYVDGVLKFKDITNPPLNAGQHESVTDHSIGPLSAGTHTIKIVADATNAIDESSESDNLYTKTITVNYSPQMNLTIPGGGEATASPSWSNGAVKAGYSLVDLKSGPTPYGTAVFSVTQNGAVVSEAGVPSSPPTISARIFIDHRTQVSAKSDNQNVGTIYVNTGFAVVNRGTGTANITYQLNGSDGSTLATGHGTLATETHKALFITELNQIAPDFVLPSNFPTSIGFASLNISSDQPLSIVALRLTTNQRGETLLTTTPVADLLRTLGTGPLFFPQLADGGGFTTSIFLMNTSNGIETGVLRIYSNNGSPLTVRQLGDTTASAAFNYNIKPGGHMILLTDGSPSVINAGSVQITPDSGTYTPVGAGVFSYSPAGTLVTESGIPSAIPTTHARVYIDRSGGHNSGLAIAAPSGTPFQVTLSAYRGDGVTLAGSGSLDLTGNGHEAKFADEFIHSLPGDFTGVLDISSSSPFVALTLRSLSNARGDFLMTTFPIADFNQPAPGPIVFPQIADGGGYRTQFILLSTTGSASTSVNCFDDSGSPLQVGKSAK